MDIDDLKVELSVATDAALNVGDLLAAAVEAGDEDARRHLSGSPAAGQGAPPRTRQRGRRMNMCDHCALAFHKAPDDGTDGCSCRRYGCGCRIKRQSTNEGNKE